MNIAHAEQITGYSIERVEHPEHKFYFQALDRDRLLVAASGDDDESTALKSLVALIYKIHSQIVMRRAGYRCEFCGALGSLEIDHKVMRSHGPDHRIENLRVLCVKDHQRRHRGEIYNDGKRTRHAVAV